MTDRMHVVAALARHSNGEKWTVRIYTLDGALVRTELEECDAGIAISTAENLARGVHDVTIVGFPIERLNLDTACIPLPWVTVYGPAGLSDPSEYEAVSLDPNGHVIGSFLFSRLAFDVIRSPGECLSHAVSCFWQGEVVRHGWNMREVFSDDLFAGTRYTPIVPSNPNAVRLH